MNSNIVTKNEFKVYYTRKEVVDKYVEKRFTTLFGRVLHNGQVAAVNQAIAKYKINNVFELACGPGRVTVGVKGIKKGFALDSSNGMLELAKQRMNKLSSEKNKWEFVKGDAFKIGKIFASKKYDMVFSFRFLRHFIDADRGRILFQINKILKRGGVLVFDAPNENIEKKIRHILGKSKYPVYDFLWDEKGLIREIKEAGFYKIKLIPNIKHFWIEGMISKISLVVGFAGISLKLINFIESIGSGRNPYEWVVVCIKK